MNITDKKRFYDIVPMTTDDEQIVIQFLKIHFFQKEPLIVCLDILKDVESLENLQNYAFKTLDNGELIIVPILEIIIRHLYRYS